MGILKMSSRTYLSNAFAMGTEPIWQHPSFTDMFLDSYLDERTRRSDLDSNAFRRLHGSLEFFERGLLQLTSEPSMAKLAVHISELHRIVADSSVVFRNIPDGDNPQAIVSFLKLVVDRVTGLRQGQMVLLPAGWVTPKESTGALLVVQRLTSCFTVALCNTGDGIVYHPSQAECSPPKVNVAFSVVLDRVELTKLSDSSWWYLLYSQIIFPKDTHVRFQN